MVSRILLDRCVHGLVLNRTSRYKIGEGAFAASEVGPHGLERAPYSHASALCAPAPRWNVPSIPRRCRANVNTIVRPAVGRGAGRPPSAAIRPLAARGRRLKARRFVLELLIGELVYRYVF
jgi:hypothetical protein